MPAELLSVQWVTIIIGGIATLAIFSFLVSENAAYRFFEHVYIGIAAGFSAVYGIRTFFWPRILEPMLGRTVVTFPDGTVAVPYNAYYLFYLIPMAVGLLFYTVYSPRYSWLSKLVIGFALASGSGLAFKGFFNENLPLITSSFKPLVVFSESGIDWAGSISNCVFVFTLIAVMYYFFFSIRAESRAAKTFAASGRWMMMVSFGAFFGSTVMARMSLLIERLQFLINTWYPAVGKLFGGQ